MPVPVNGGEEGGTKHVTDAEVGFVALTVETGVVAGGRVHSQVSPGFIVTPSKVVLTLPSEGTMEGLAAVDCGQSNIFDQTSPATVHCEAESVQVCESGHQPQ